MQEIYKRNLRDYARDRQNILIIIYSKDDIRTKQNGLLYDLIIEELGTEKTSWVKANEVEFTDYHVVIFE